MSDIERKIKELAQIEEYDYILSAIADKGGVIKGHLNDSLGCCPKAPVAPAKPKPVEAFPNQYPPYDEEKYLRKAKEGEKGKYAQLRTNCIIAFFALMGSLIGIVVCWIPLLVALFSLPAQVSERRNQAYQIYLQECEDLKRKKQEALKNAVKYRNDLEEYQRKCKEHELQMIEFDRKANLLRKKEEWIDKKIQEIEKVSSRLYSSRYTLVQQLSLPQNYSNYVSVHMIMSYLNSGRAGTLEECIHLHNQEEAEGKIIPNLSYAKKYKEKFQKNAPEVYQSLSKCDQMSEKLQKELQSYAVDHWDMNYYTDNTNLELDRFLQLIQTTLDLK